ncbi:hypothetical protein COLAER_02403 [Collinsella aerofaciens ATCC 25986]|uniref:Uncharacterized protein n=1 Tax=Collinsella aerofaciens (strain ATCC 25986 / DSM 3979 / JCM 10188 / KCTC 3647 / NCTC 11838 / VPI 1003) TaxID=411903 RepID=A4ED62_COLAA|nr:hypothetical protein COLAER_02403 [Collinsella aerofaciens ATCC 25986]
MRCHSKQRSATHGSLGEPDKIVEYASTQISKLADELANAITSEP